MPATIDYYLTCVSPWAYLGHPAILDLAARHGATLDFKPVNLGAMFKVSGQVGVADRPLVRQRYRLIELQRHAEARGRKLNLRPAHFPTNPALADQTVCAIVADGGEARFRARASNLAYEELRKATALTPTCSTTAASTLLPAPSGHGLDTPTITRTLSAPQGCNGSTWSDRIMRVEITVAYGPSTERQEVKHALYVAK